jgi:hypothetical protein
LSNIIFFPQHGGGQVFISLHGLVQSLKDGSTSHGIILVASTASASRHLSYCGLEHDIKTAVSFFFYQHSISVRIEHRTTVECVNLIFL